MKIAIGLDIGGTNTKIVLASEKGRVLVERELATPSVKDASGQVEDLLIKTLKAFLDSPSVKTAVSGITDSPEFVGIGIGAAGLIDRKNGTILKSPNIDKIDGVPLRGIFEKEFSMPVLLENDANAYTYGEKWLGAGRDFDNFVVLTLGTGLGAGLIYKGELYEGPVEVGHMMIAPNGRYCTCGSYGCLESYVSGRAIVDRVTSSLEKGAESLLVERCEGNFYKVTPEIIFEGALEGDSLSREVFREFGQFLGMGIANLLNILDLEAVIIGGGLIGAWDMFIDEVYKEACKRAFAPLCANVQIIKSAFTKSAGSIGAAGLLFKKLAEKDSREMGQAG